MSPLLEHTRLRAVWLRRAEPASAEKTWYAPTLASVTRWEYEPGSAAWKWDEG
jgi:hypothetical protein